MRRSRSRSRSPRRIRRRQSDPENGSLRHRSGERPERELEDRRRRPDREFVERRGRSDRQLEERRRRSDARRDAEQSDLPDREGMERNRERSLDADSGEEQGGRRRDWQNERRRDSWGGDAEQRTWTRGRRGRVGSWRETGEARAPGMDPQARAHGNPAEQSGGYQSWERDEPTGSRPVRAKGDDPRERQRRSVGDEMEEGPTLNLNPTDVPKADSYFLHDDRAVGGRGRYSSRRSRFHSDSTPHKWGHDMYDRLYGDEKTPPPDEEELIPAMRTRSVVNRIGGRGGERSERDRREPEQRDRSSFDPNARRWGHDKYHQLYGDGAEPQPDNGSSDRVRSSVRKVEILPAKGPDRIEM